MQRVESDDEYWNAGLRSNPLIASPVNRRRRQAVHAPKRLCGAFFAMSGAFYHPSWSYGIETTITSPPRLRIRPLRCAFRCMTTPA